MAGPSITIRAAKPRRLSTASAPEEPPGGFRLTRRMSISDNQFNKLVLHPSNVARTKPDKEFGNPTPIALAGFLIAVSQQSCDLMGFRGTGGNVAAGTACYIFFGGVLQFAGGLLEFMLGHTFPSVVFCSFGAFFFSVGTALIPSLNTWGAYAPEGLPAASGLKTAEYHASAGFFPLWMALLCFIYMILALRTNICFVAIFFMTVLGLCFDTAAHWLFAADYTGNMEMSRRMQTAAGAVLFIGVLIGWYVFASVMLVSIDFPFQLPVGELSDVIRGRTERGLVDAMEKGEASGNVSAAERD